MATRFSGRRSRSTRLEPPTMGKQLVKLPHLVYLRFSFTGLVLILFIFNRISTSSKTLHYYMYYIHLSFNWYTDTTDSTANFIMADNGIGGGNPNTRVIPLIYCITEIVYNISRYGRKSNLRL
jgi:hypothetical protein